MAADNADETTELRLAFNSEGLIPAIVADAKDNAVLMMAWMNNEALAQTQATGLVHFFSRSRKKLWMKGESSGETFRVAGIKVDCDQDCLLVTVTPQKAGAACHTGRRSCFYRAIDDGKLTFTD